jgi:hypothetical protein
MLYDNIYTLLLPNHHILKSMTHSALILQLALLTGMQFGGMAWGDTFYMVVLLWSGMMLSGYSNAWISATWALVV